jgi:hypothetical protein
MVTQRTIRSATIPAVTSSPDPAPLVIDRAVLEAELTRILDAADAAGVTLRALGSIGVALHCHDAATIIPSFERTYADLDLAAYKRDHRTLTGLMASLGYQDDREIFVESEGGRSIFLDPMSRIHVDVFYDRLEFCHAIPLNGRLEADRPTIPVAELLLSKLQIFRINEKDVVDIILLLLDHPIGSGDADTIDLGRIARLSADDWGLWRTLTQNLEKVASLASTYPQLDHAQHAHVVTAARALKAGIDAQPKSMGWRMRDRVGDRRQWWTDVDEVR